MDVLPLLARAFAGVTVLDTSIFMKTMKRQRASPRGNRALDWKGSPTLRGAPIDELFDDNCRIVTGSLARRPDHGLDRTGANGGMIDSAIGVFDFAALDDLAFAAERGRLNVDAIPALNAQEIGPVLELVRLSSQSRLLPTPQTASWLGVHVRFLRF